MKIEIRLPTSKEIKKAISEELRIEEIHENYLCETTIKIRGGIPGNSINGISIYTWQGQLENIESTFHIMTVKWVKCEEAFEEPYYHIGDPKQFKTIDEAREYIFMVHGEEKVLLFEDN